jgi:hypothetical protein
MSIQNVYGSIATTPTPDLTSVGTPTRTTGSIPPPASGAASATISAPGQLFSEMQQLSQSNATEFKAVASQLAKSFQNAANQASGQDAQVLSSVASRFSQAAQTGSLQPPQPTTAPAAAATGAQAGSGAHHHHHHHGGSGGGGQSSVVDQAFQSAMTILNQATQGTTATQSTSST